MKISLFFLLFPFIFSFGARAEDQSVSTKCMMIGAGLIAGQDTLHCENGFSIVVFGAGAKFKFISVSEWIKLKCTIKEEEKIHYSDKYKSDYVGMFGINGELNILGGYNAKKFTSLSGSTCSFYGPALGAALDISLARAEVIFKGWYDVKTRQVVNRSETEQNQQ